MYPVQGKFRTYDLDLVELRFEGEKLVLEPTPGKSTVTRIARTISHNGKLVGVTDEVHQSEADGPALMVETDGQSAHRVYVSVSQGTRSEDLLARAANEQATVQFFLVDKNDEAGISNCWLFAAKVRMPAFVPFGRECATRVFTLDVVDDDGDEGDEDEVDDWSARPFTITDARDYLGPAKAPFSVN